MKLPEPFFFETSKRAVLLLHAFTGSANDHRMLGRALEAANYTVYAPNFSGHGTGKVQDLLSVPADRWVEDGRRAYEFLKNQGYDQIAVMGLSLGGTIATKLAIDEQPIAAGSFCSPIVEVDINNTNVPSEFMRYARANLHSEGVTNNDIDGETSDMRDKLAITLEQINVITREVYHNLDKITQPYYIAQAEQDELINPRSGELLAAKIHNAPVTFHSFDKSTHVITVAKQHKEFEQTLINFLDQLDWEG